MANDFKRFKKRVEAGKLKMLAIPPPVPPGPGMRGTAVGLVKSIGKGAAKGKSPRPARDLSQGKPKDLRNEFLRKANKAANQNKPAYKEKIGPNRPQGPEAPKYSEKIGPKKPASTPKKISTSTKAAGGATAMGTALGVAAYGITSTRDNKPTFPKGKGTAASPKKSSSFGPRISEGAKFERLRASRAALGGAKASSDVKVKKSSTSNTAATVAAASSGGTSKAASVASASSSTTGKTTGKSTTVVKERVGLQSRYQRDALAMETRNKSGNKAKKSILSLFRKG